MNFEIMGRVAEQKIQEAIEEGKFDNLPGKGKPIVFDDDMFTPSHIRLANLHESLPPALCNGCNAVG